MSEYGLSGSATYAVTYDTFDKLMDVLPDNDVQQITAQNMRNVVYTLWENGGGGAGSFSYTHEPVAEASTIAVGGIPVGSTFDNVPLQTLFDNMFYPAVGGEYSISTSPPALELGNPNSRTTVTVTIKKKTPTINSINVSGGPGNTFVPPTIPTTFNGTITKSYPNTNVVQDTLTTYTLTVVDSTETKSPQASVTWFYPRWYGSIDLNQLISSSLDTKTLTTSQKTTIIDTLKGPDNDWKPVWFGSNLTFFTAESGQLSSATVTPKNTASGSHIVLIWLSSDYGGDGDPSGYTFGGFFGRPFIDLGTQSVENQYGTIKNCRIWIKDFKSAGKESFTINN